MEKVVVKWQRPIHESGAGIGVFILQILLVGKIKFP